VAFTQLVAQANRSGPTSLPALDAADATPGVSPAVTLPAGTTSVTFRLTSSNWVAGSGDLVESTMDVDYGDGQGWRQIGSYVTEEGHTSKDGGMPYIGLDFNGPLADEAQLRSRFRIAGTLRFGLDWEVVP
jgi:hypothetical protein